MKTFELRETNMPQLFRSALISELTGSGANGNAVHFVISDTTNEKDQRNDSVYPFTAFIGACARIMSADAMKSKDHKTALVFSDPKGAGSMLMACVSEWIPEGDDGNYNFYFTFDPEDIKGIPEDAVKPFYDIQAIMPWGPTLRGVLSNVHCRRIDDVEILNGITILVVKTICNWLDANASENEEIAVEFKDSTVYDAELTAEGKAPTPIDFETYKSHWVTYATATVSVERGLKKKTMTFGEEMKAIAKGNADLT